MPPKPYVFKSEKELISALKGIDSTVKQYYKRKPTTLEIMAFEQVSANTYRVFRKSKTGTQPSVTFQNWARKFLEKTIPDFYSVTNQSDFDSIVDKATLSLCADWKKHMKYPIEYGRAAKLVNLLFKALPNWLALSKSVQDRLRPLLHVPLDSFSIQGLINISNLRIPANASMGFVRTRAHYSQFQEEIRRITKKAGVTPIHYDILAWDKAH